MALFPRNPPTNHAQNPALMLQSALQEFEAALSPEQNLQYRTAATRPDQATVIAFVSQLDEKQSSGRCVSTKLLTFLDALQQFTAIVDTFVSSNSAVAALVWGCVRTAILAASNISSFFIKVTDLIMTIGMLCPAYAQFADLYPGSVQLQAALCADYASVVRTYTQIMTMSNRTKVLAALAAVINPFETAFTEHITQLQRRAKVVELECQNAAALAAMQEYQLADEERRAHQSFRLRIGIDREEAKEWRLQRSRCNINKLRQRIRNELSQLDSLKVYKRFSQQRARNTANWFRTETSFIDWQKNTQSALLWCVGKMGSGKSVLMSSMIGDLLDKKRPGDVLAHHFCLSDDRDKTLRARNVIGSIARQLLDYMIETKSADELEAFSRQIQNADNGSLTTILGKQHLSGGTIYILLDGIDECEATETRDIVMCLSSLLVRCQRIKVVVSSRPDAKRAIQQIGDTYHRIIVSEANTSDDIEKFIRMELAERLDHRDLTVYEPSTILRIYDKLSGVAQGMFLWVRLFIDDLCQQNCDADIVKLLQSAPPSIAEMIDAKVQRVQEAPNRHQTIPIMRFCGVLRRPLTCSEMCELLSLAPGQTSRADTRIMHETAKAVQASHGLLYVDEEEQTIHYVHSGVKDHLFGTAKYRFSFTAQDVDLHLGVLVLTYLGFNDFKRALTKKRIGQKFQLNPLQIGARSVPGGTSSIAKTILEMYTASKGVKTKDLEDKLLDALGGDPGSDDPIGQRYPFLLYARTYWIDHIDFITPGSDSEMWMLLSKVLRGDDTMAEKPWLSSDKTTDSTNGDSSANMFDWAVSNQKQGLVIYILERHINVVTEAHQIRMIQGLTAKELLRIMQLLIRKGPVCRSVYLAAFLQAARWGSPECIDMCIQQGFSVDSRLTPDDLTPLQAAAGAGHVEVVHQLLNAKANTNAAPPNNTGPTALQAAAGEGHLEVVGQLLQAEAHVNAAPDKHSGRTALQAAAGKGRFEVVNQLLDVNAFVNAAPARYNGRTALQAAVDGRHLEVIDQLLKAKADVNGVPATYNGRTALQAAAEGGQLEVVKWLLDMNANVNAAPAMHHGRTAIQAAAEQGNLEVVDQLLISKAVVNAAPAEYSGRTALQAAAEQGHLEMVNRLLNAKADVNAAPAENDGRTALQAAASRGHLEVMNRLLDVNANVNATPAKYGGRTALQAAVEGDHLEVLRCLEIAGAKAD